MADQPPACAPGGPGVDILGLCLVVDPFLEGILYALPLIFAFLAAALTGKTWRARIRGWLYGARWSTAYAGLLDWTLDKLTRFFGPPLSWRAFGRCIALAIIYSVGFRLVQNTLSEAGDATFLPILVSFGITVPVGTGFFFLFRSIRRADVAASGESGDSREAGLPIREEFLSALLGALGWIVTASIAYAVGIAVTVASGVNVTNGNMGEVAAAAATAVAIAIAVAGAIAGTIGGVAAVALAFTIALVITLDISGGGAIGFSFSAFLIAVPLANAVFDWPSWWVSRWLMTRLRDDALRPRIHQRSIALIGHLALDGALALLCLFGLAIVIASIANGIDSPGLWALYREARLIPFAGTGAAMTLMMLSTLVPTAIHLFFALFALAVVRPPYAAQTAHWLQEDQEGGEIGTQMLVALYLTACAGFALLTLWAAGRLIIWGLNGLVGGAGIWPLIFDTADRFVIF